MNTISTQISSPSRNTFQETTLSLKEKIESSESENAKVEKVAQPLIQQQINQIQPPSSSQGFLENVTPYVNNGDNISHKTILVFFAVVASIWSAGQACTFIGQAEQNSLLQGIGLGLNGFAVFVMTGGGIVGGAAVGGSIARETLKRELLLRPTANNV